ncbi:MAG TPA: immunoglobulin-like domain-containing protein [Mobilitalea sp.]|nr:immunoglobulin-like domain-containing protein [Mobilitalea sp.]
MIRSIFTLIGIVLLTLTFVGCNSADYKDYEPTPYAETNFSENVKLSIKGTKVTTVTNEITLVFENLTNEDYTFGKEFIIEVLHKKKWLVVPYKSDIGWDGIGYVVQANDTIENTIVLSHAYDELPEGQYRIIKKIMNTKLAKEYIIAEFKIE